MTSSTIAIIITIITMILFFINKFPMSVVACISTLAMGILIPEMKLSQIYSGFGGSSIVMVAGMCIVGDALFQTGIAQRIGAKIASTPIAKNERVFIVAIVIICTIMSAFLSNSGCIAMWMPIIASIAAGSKGKIRSKMVIFPAGIACIIGGACTLVGSVSQVTANSILMGYAGYEEGLGVFDMSRVMVPAAILQVVFWATIGYSLLRWALKPGSPDFDKNNSFANPSNAAAQTMTDIPRWKGTLSVVVLIGCIVLFILCGFAPFKNYFNIANIALLGATILFATGCVPVKSTLAELPWDVLICIGAITGLGTGLDASGGGAIIANFVLNMFGGESASVIVLTVVITVLTSVLTLFMQNGSVAAMLTPICISMALALGISPVPWVIVIAIGTNLAIATPIGTAVNMQILPAGYTFKDFVKIGGPLFVLLVAAVSVLSCTILF
ncbi:SLC13 family permease [uncultured Clostridium sp.]|uniref:SLC13 family permease n=1 Tax=uncultured Clostridium sp. TaxID=59620 RepID=UPI0025FB960B|nr:SLC13 family permease [uncultured Clostridium sp.]